MFLKTDQRISTVKVPYQFSLLPITKKGLLHTHADSCHSSLFPVKTSRAPTWFFEIIGITYSQDTKHASYIYLLKRYISNKNFTLYVNKNA